MAGVLLRPLKENQNGYPQQRHSHRQCIDLILHGQPGKLQRQWHLSRWCCDANTNTNRKAVRDFLAHLRTSLPRGILCGVGFKGSYRDPTHPVSCNQHPAWARWTRTNGGRWEQASCGHAVFFRCFHELLSTWGRAKLGTPLLDGVGETEKNSCFSRSGEPSSSCSMLAGFSRQTIQQFGFKRFGGSRRLSETTLLARDQHP